MEAGGNPQGLTVVVVGASGDLARKKIFPALFALFCQGHLPERLSVFGFSRSAYSDNEFRERIAETLTCRYAPGASCADRMAGFLARCRYVSGRYDSADSFLDLYEAMRAAEGRDDADRLFYLAVPPAVFTDVARAIGGAGLVRCAAGGPWSRVVVEKPFGRDRGSSDALIAELGRVFDEQQTFRIDHYLAKEVIQNLLVLRFANLVFEPLWNRSCVERVSIEWKESQGVGGRGGYFDGYGILRDVVQNHLLQILALVAMEKPRTAGAGDVRDEKVRVLRSIPPLRLDDLVLGQYTRGRAAGQAGYREEPGVARDSIVPTYALAVLRVENDRWRGVPFVISAGKALDGTGNSVTVHFRAVPRDIFREHAPRLPANRLVIRVQPDEAITLHVVNKEPGLCFELAESSLDLRYRAAFQGLIPDAYERLLLDVMAGDRSLFIRADEVAAAWDIFTPALHLVESLRLKPEEYQFGSAGPAAAVARLAAEGAGG